MSRRYRPGQHDNHDGFLQHAFATSHWLGGIVAALIILVGLVLALIKTARQVLAAHDVGGGLGFVQST
jgi:hypothetical protein